MKEDREIRDRVGRFMLAHGLHMGDKVDAGKVQDMLVEYVTKFSARQHTALVRGCASLGAQNVLLKAENARLRRLQGGEPRCPNCRADLSLVGTGLSRIRCPQCNADYVISRGLDFAKFFTLPAPPPAAEPPIKQAHEIIAAELYRTLLLLGADHQLLGTIGSWADGQSEKSVLENIEAWNSATALEPAHGEEQK